MIVVVCRIALDEVRHREDIRVGSTPTASIRCTVCPKGRASELGIDAVQELARARPTDARPILEGGYK
jgi:hypothetical protein